MLSRDLYYSLQNAIFEMSDDDVMRLWNDYAHENSKPQVYRMSDFDDVVTGHSILTVIRGLDPQFDANDDFFGIDLETLEINSFNDFYAPGSAISLEDLTYAIATENDSFGNESIQAILDADTIDASTKVQASASIYDDYEHVSQCSFDFIHDGNYNFREMEKLIMDAFDKAGTTPLGVDFREVDYSGYPEYADKIVSQCGVDFGWSDTLPPTVSAKGIEEEIEEALETKGYELIGIDFYSVEE